MSVRPRDVIGSRPLTARSVLASALLGADEPVLPVAGLIAAASLFGISAGAARTCLWRMVANGELTSDDGSYALAGRLLERRHRVDDAAHHEDTGRWNGTWELAVVSLERRPAADRLELRTAAMALHLAEIREGVWIRPDNLDPQRLPTSRAVLDAQCVHFHGADSDITVDATRSLFSLDSWSDDARSLILAMDDELDAQHPASEEEYFVSATTAEKINRARENGGRVIAVGTTVVRALESVADENGRVRGAHDYTQLKVDNRHRFKAVDGLLTGLHEPQASHLDLLSAFLPPDKIRAAYEEAIARKYLWHEFGDLNLIL